MTLLAGIDYSTRQIDVAIIPLDPTARDMPPPTFRTEPVWQPKGCDAVTRIRNVRSVVRDLLDPTERGEVSSVWIEEPYGRYRTADRQLLPLYGAIIAAIPGFMAAAGIPTQEWRRVLGLPPRLTKPEAIHTARQHLGPSAPPDLTEHQAEALLIALAARTLTWQTVA